MIKPPPMRIIKAVEPTEPLKTVIISNLCREPMTVTCQSQLVDLYTERGYDYSECELFRVACECLKYLPSNYHLVVTDDKKDIEGLWHMIKSENYDVYQSMSVPAFPSRY